MAAELPAPPNFPLSGTCNPPTMLSWVDASPNPGALTIDPSSAASFTFSRWLADGRIVPR